LSETAAKSGTTQCLVCGGPAERGVICSPCLVQQLRQVLGDTACRRLGLIELPAGLKLSVVVPVYNEKNTIREILRRIRAVRIPKEIILVDDCSKDGTRDVLQQIEREELGGCGRPDPDASDTPQGEDTALTEALRARAEVPMNTLRVLYHERNCGKGAALRTGFAHVTGTVVIVQDADLEYDPAEYPQLIAPIIDGRADVVYGSRFIGETHRVLFYWHYIGNTLLTTLSNMFTGLNLTDMETCYKVFRREAIDAIAPTLKSNRFGFEPEITAKIAKRRLRVYELPVSYSGRDYSEGKKITWKDGLQALWCIIRYRFVD
jgi:glycosyltransferase involved in cell wall biosynthesis